MAKSGATPAPKNERLRPAPGATLPGHTQTTVTYAASRLEHWITDEELSQLSELRKDNVVEIFWGCLGIFFGALIPAVQAMQKIGNPTQILGWSDFATALIFAVSFLLAAIMAWFWWQRSSRADDLVNVIRTRPKMIVVKNDG